MANVRGHGRASLFDGRREADTHAGSIDLVQGGGGIPSGRAAESRCRLATIINPAGGHVAALDLDTDFVLWDHDGVIVDTEPWFFEATRNTLRDFGVQLSQEQWLRLQAAGRGLEEFATGAASAPLNFREIRRVRDDVYAQLLRDNDVMIAGAPEVLGQVAARFRMAMVTTSLRRFVDQIHVGTSLLDHFDHIVSAEDCTRHKPDPEPYLLAMESLGATPARSIAVEDSLRGFNSARAAGLRCIVVRSEFMSGYKFDGAHAVLDDIRELPLALDRRRP